MDEPYLILKVEPELRFDDLGKPEEKMRVQFKVGVHGPFYERFDKVGFTAFAVKQRLEAFARELAAMAS